MTSLRILSRLVFLAIFLSQLISAQILLSSSFCRRQQSDPYIRTRRPCISSDVVVVSVCKLVQVHRRQSWGLEGRDPRFLNGVVGVLEGLRGVVNGCRTTL